MPMYLCLLSLCTLLLLRRHRAALGFSLNHRTSAKSSLCCANPPPPCRGRAGGPAGSPDRPVRLSPVGFSFGAPVLPLLIMGQRGTHLGGSGWLCLLTSAYPFSFHIHTFQEFIGVDPSVQSGSKKAVVPAWSLSRHGFSCCLEAPSLPR